MLLTIFFFTLLIQLLMSFGSLIGGVRFLQYVSGRINEPNTAFDGLVTIIVPCCGDEIGLKENLEAILAQERGAFEVVFVVAEIDDTALPVLEDLCKAHASSQIVFAGKATGTGQKVHNLLAAVRAASDKSAAYVFADSDARPSSHWLENLLSPLNDDSNGCSSGYRWFVQKRGGAATHLRSAWNASITSSLGADRARNFCWGGSMALTKATWDQLEVAKHWQGTLSDDFSLTNIVKKAGLLIHFEPKCLTATVGDTTFREFFEFSTRQMKITKVYSPKHFWISFVGAAMFSLTFFPLIFILPGLEGFWFWAGALTLTLLIGTGCGKAIIRIYAVKKCLSQYSREIEKQYFWQIVLWPFSTLIFLLNDIIAVCSRKIRWRGITYELISKNKTRIIEN